MLKLLGIPMSFLKAISARLMPPKKQKLIRMEGEINEILARAESNQERLASIFRIVVFVALLGTVLSLQQDGSHHHPVLSATLMYGGIALIGLVLAWRRKFHPFLPYIFVTFEVGLVVLQTALLASLMGQPPSLIAAMPVTTIIFVILAHAAMRYRPWLIVYASTLFLMGLLIAVIVMPENIDAAQVEHAGDHGLVHYQVFHIIVFIVTALLLFVTARGTRRLLRISVEERLARTRLSRFFAPDIANQLVSSSAVGSTGGQNMPVVVLFADIRGFSSLAENMEPSRLSIILAEYREILSDAIQRNGGVVDKFIGDAVMAVFGFPDSKNSPPHRALACAREILSDLSVWSREREANGLAAVETGIGIHCGDAFVGVIGKGSLLEFTVIGDTVNVAERVERLTRPLNANLAISGSVAREVNVVSGAEWKVSPNAQLTGRDHPVDIYYLPRNPLDGGQSERESQSRLDPPATGSTNMVCENRFREGTAVGSSRKVTIR
jgi:adenylate cyclase